MFKVLQARSLSYFSSPGLSRDAMLKMTGVELRGGILYITKRHSKANNKYIKNYDPTKPLEYILYLDMNNL